MTALITGASSGIGEEFARQLASKGYDIIAVARRIDRLEKLKDSLFVKVIPIACDLSDRQECINLCEKLKDYDIDIVINNAGFGKLGFFTDIPLEDELSMTYVNCCALHILTKHFLRKFEEKGHGYILNVCSVGAYPPGPLLANYYATKAYVKSLTIAINEEERVKGKDIYIGCLCPGPVNTEFSDVANVRFAIKSRSASFVVGYAIRKMFKKKTVIIPGIEVKLSALASKLLPEKLMAKITYRIQKKKM